MSAKKKSSTSKKQSKAAAKAADAAQPEVEVPEVLEAEPERGEDEAEAAEAAASSDASEGVQEADPEAEVAALKDRMARLQADFENYRRRVLREKDETYRRANEDIMEEMLPVLDHLGLAFSSASKQDLDNPVVMGVKLVADQLSGALAKFGLEAIEADGQPFDPNLHEALSHLPSADVEENCVMAQVRCGYKLGSYLLRAAQVVVSSGPPEVAEAEASDTSETSA